MTTPDTFAGLINGTGAAVRHGMLVRISANKTFLLAQADSAAHLAGYEGVNGSGTIGAGGPANIYTTGASVDVLLETGLTPVAGQTVYVSATVAGRGTNVQPANVQTVGTIQDASQYARTGLVAVSVTGGGGGAAAGSGAILCWINVGRASPGPITITGATIGMKVRSAASIAGPNAGGPGANSGFETTISVTNQIQQTTGTDLSGDTIFFILQS